MKKLFAVLAVVAVLGGGVAYAYSTEPGWWVRIWYPLRYETIVRGHARNYRLDPALLAAVIYQESKFNASAESSSTATATTTKPSGCEATTTIRTPAPAASG